jgi:hypothetical protein
VVAGHGLDGGPPHEIVGRAYLWPRLVQAARLPCRAVPFSSDNPCRATRDRAEDTSPRRRDEGGQGRVGGAPGGAALTARSVPPSTLDLEAHQGFLVASLLVERLPLLASKRRRVAGVPAYLGARRRRRRLQDGVRGVPTNMVRPLVLGRLSDSAGSNRVAGSWSQIIDGWTPCACPGGKSVRRPPRRPTRRRCAACGSSDARACGPR